ncbi:hypothetical protein Tsubulata_012730, partial [Turnera subulata]
MESNESTSSLHATIQGSSSSSSSTSDRDLTRPARKRPRYSSSASSPENGGVDRISDLPDDVLQLILSFLPIAQAIRTSFLLSKRWGSLWASMPNLLFSSRPSLPPRRFASFVDKTLSLYQSKKVKKFSVELQVLKALEGQVGSWVNFAITHHVVELCLVFRDVEGRENSITACPDRYLLPLCLYTSSSLKELRLRLCELKPNGLDTVSWASLKLLSLAYTRLNNDSLKALLLGSPALAYLRLDSCSGFNLIDASASTTLKELVVDGYCCDARVDGVLVQIRKYDKFTINGPNLLRLTILGCLRTHCRLEDVSSLVEAHIGFHMQDNTGFLILTGRRAMLRSLLEKLELILSTFEKEGLSLPSSTRKVLTVNIGKNKLDIPGMASLLRSSPHLQKLTINMQPYGKSLEVQPRVAYSLGENYWTSQERAFKCLQLQGVEVFGFYARHPDSGLILDLVGFLLKNAKVLEKIVIHVRSRCKPWGRVDHDSQDIKELFEITQLLLRHPRASPSA